MIHQSIDYLELTYPDVGNGQLPVRNDVFPPEWSQTTVETKARNGYSSAIRYPDGRALMWNDDSRRMGMHIEMTGSVCQRLEVDASHLQWFIQNGARITRLDCAVDITDTPCPFDEIWSLAKAGDYECRLRKPPSRNMDAATGDTIYFGKMKSTACTRIYNKAAERKVAGVWTRVETMFRHGRANTVGKGIANGQAIGSYVRGHVNLPRCQWWADVMTMDAVKTRLARPEADKRQEWLLKSVAPTLAKEINLNGLDFWAMFRDAVFSQVTVDTNEW